MPTRSCTACPAQDHLPAHELAVIFADGAFGGCEARIRSEGARRPFPDVAERAATPPRSDGTRLGKVISEIGVRPNGATIPFGVAWQPCAGPAGEGVGLAITH